MEDLKQVLGIDPERLAADADRFFSHLGDLPQPGSTARAESKDGYVSAEYSCVEGVRDLRLNPRAMRMDSARLAETVLDLIRQAKERAEAEERKRAEELLGAGNAFFADRQFIGDRLRDAAGALRQNLERASATIDRVRVLLRP